jgi:hypothetical protein
VGRGVAARRDGERTGGAVGNREAARRRSIWGAVSGIEVGVRK